MLFIANWKANQNLKGVLEFIAKIENNSVPPKAEVIVCPSNSFLALSQWRENQKIILGAQNVSEFEQGSYTGESTADNLEDLGVEYCIIGHSERKKLFNETNEQIIAKANNLLKFNIKPIVCLGSINDLYDLSLLQNNLKQCLFCYEPVEYISEDGEYKKIDADVIEIKMREIKMLLPKETPLLYGGSVNQENVAELIKIGSLAGFLVGNSSLKYEEFFGLIYEALC